jgi:RNA polymerase sigma-70 factor (ECF subfamily)
MLPVAAIADVFRAERTRVLATVIRICNGDFELAEEAVQEAFAAAVVRWPGEGRPAEPRAWLITVARHKAIDQIRRNAKLRALVAAELVTEPEAEPVTDDRLRLIFTCCHPALAPEAQVALTLRTLGGLTTEEIARAFLTSPVTMAQRLVRAKAKIRDAGIPYKVPEPDQLAESTAAVMAVIYLIFNEGYAATSGDEWIRKDLCSEAIQLGRLLVELLHEDPEPRGLLALMLLHDARRDTRTDDAGDLVLLEDQDRSRWDRAQIAEALQLVPIALRAAGSTYGIEAAIAALHCSAVRAADTDWAQIALLYEARHRRAPSPIIALNHAVAVAMANGPAAGLVLIEPLERSLEGYYLWHAARADLLRRLDRKAEAARAYRRALAAVGSDPERRFLARRLAQVIE